MIQQREIKFRAWIKTSEIGNEVNEMSYQDNHTLFSWIEDGTEMILMQYTGLKDLEENEIYHGDILEFENGDRGIVLKEDWEEFYFEFIGDPECEDQARDFYRLERTNIIGNVFQNPELIKE